MLKYSIGSKVLDLLLVEICECLLLFFCCWMCMPIYQFHFQLVSIFHTDCVPKAQEYGGFLCTKCQFAMGLARNTIVRLIFSDMNFLIFTL